MNIDLAQLKKLLLDSNALTEEALALAEKSAKAQDKEFQDYILENNLIKDDNLGQLVANYMKIPYVDLSGISIDQDILDTVPEIVARKQQVIIFKRDENGYHVAMVNPGNLQVINMLKKKLGENIVVHYATADRVREALSSYAKDATQAFEDIISENVREAKSAKGKSVELPVIKIVETVIEYAYKNKASDVHIEPEEDYSLLRFRVDGILHDIVKLPKSIHDEISTRIKVLSSLRTDEHHAPQDGKIEYKVDNEMLNLRVSIVPVTEGEKIVLRLLSEQARKLSLADLGFRGEAMDRVNRAYKKPYGMILTTGPTGSGKTTTLYSIVKLLNKREINIMTIEDPVEYDIENINQIQINPKTSLTFASGLRSIVRQDPDIILVGEIRDQETAKIAVNSAMTGHLVLSTLHTNDAATTIPRLFDMGVESFLVASSVNVIVGQRLVRKICEHCRISYEMSEKEVTEAKQNISEKLVEKHFGKKKSIRAYKGKGCDVCHHTGYLGRIGIYEVMEVDDDIRDAIVQRKDADTISDMAVSKGMETMIEDGLEKVKSGITTIAEIIRVTKE